MIDVQLYIYDLSNGMAKQMSLGLLGKQIEAVYHTSIVIEGLEYVYDGGVKAVPAGKTHLGPPLRTTFLGKTELPMDVILEFLESMKETYTEKAYDIWTYNCNNFSNEFATFLVGHGIPKYISNLPQTVLKTPFGQMIKPYIDRMVKQAQANKGGLLGIKDAVNVVESNETKSILKFATSPIEFDNFLQKSEKSSAIVFFTSQNCGPCKALYPLFQKLAVDAAGKVTFIMVDIMRTQEIGMRYSIRATPTFMAFMLGRVQDKWTGSDPHILQKNVKILIELVGSHHPHDLLPLPLFRSTDTQLLFFTKVPPLPKLKTKLGPIAEDSIMLKTLQFITPQSIEGTNNPLPDLDALSRFLRSAILKFDPKIMFFIVDVFRIGMAQPNFSRYFAEEKGHKTVASIISYVNSLNNCPYPLRLVTLQLSCNLFTSDQYHSHIIGCPSLSEPIVQLTATSLMDHENLSTRIAASGLAFNITTVNQKMRSNKNQNVLPGEQQIELAASLLEAIINEKDSSEVLKGCLLALAGLVYRAPANGELVDLLKSMDAQKKVLSMKKRFLSEPLIEEIGKELLGEELK